MDELDIGVFHALPEILFVVREETIVWANEAATRLLGAALVGARLEAILASGERHRLGLLEAQRRESWDLPATCRIRFKRLDGSGEVATDLRFGHRGDSLVVSARDITEVTRAEALMSTLAQTFARGSTLLDADGLLDATESTFQALGWIVAFTEILDDGSVTRRVMATPGDPVGDYGKTLVGVRMPFDKTPILAEVIRTGRPIFLDNLPTLLAGPVREARALGASMERAQVIRSAWCPVVTNGRCAYHLAVTGRDLTEHDFVAIQLFAAQIGAAIHMTALRASLVQKERLAAVGEMAAVMAHEVRNPLGVIFNALAGLEKRIEKGSANEELLLIIREEADRLRRLVTDLLDFSRPSLADIQTVTIAPVIAEAATAARLDPTLEGNAAEVLVEVAPDLPAVETDPRLFRRVLVNLLVNALQNVPAGGRVSVATHRHHDDSDHEQLHVRVHNDGPAMTAEVAARVFEPFFTTRASGTGLGLALVRRILDDLGGTVELDQNLAAGVTFVLKLPIAERNAA